MKVSKEQLKELENEFIEFVKKEGIEISHFYLHLFLKKKYGSDKKFYYDEVGKDYILTIK